MNMFVNKFFIPFFLLAQLNVSFGQDLKRVKLYKQDLEAGIVEKYEYIGKSHFYSNLILYSNHSYRYEEGVTESMRFNWGTWYRSKNHVILKDSIDRNNLPIILKYLNKADTTINFVIQIIRNLNGEYLTDGFVYINDDSTQCLPLTGTCLRKFDKIDSMKIVFENGYKSKWIKVDQPNYKQILPVLKTNFSMYSYTSLRYNRYQIMDAYLKPKK